MPNSNYIVVGPVDGNVSENSATPTQAVLTTAFDNKGRQLLYVKAGAANLSANAAVVVNTAGRATANVTAGDWGTCAAITANQYGWAYRREYVANTSIIPA